MYVYMYIYKASKSDLSILAALRLQELKGSILISTPAVAHIYIYIYMEKKSKSNGPNKKPI